MRHTQTLILPALLLALAACGDSTSSTPAIDDGAELTMQRMPGPVDPNAPLPPGHPAVGGGAPPISTTSGELPPGHPSVGAATPPGMGGTASAGAPPVQWTVPTGWVQTRPSSSMRIAQFVVAELDGAAVECRVFGGIGGTADQNVQRWIGQFTSGPDGTPAADAAKVTDIEVNGLSVKRLDLTGVFGGGMMAGGAGAPGEGLWRMLACTIDGAGAPVQILLAGPVDVVAEHEARFDELIRSLRPARR